MANIKDILTKLSKGYEDKLEAARKTAENMVKTAEAALAAGREVQTAKGAPSPKK